MRNNPKAITGSITYDTLKSVLDQLTNEGYTPEDYQYLIFEKSYSNCYYEGDEPEIIICDSRK